MTLLRDPTKNINSFVRNYTELSSLISMADNPRLTTQSSLAAQGHISLSHDDSANRPLSKPDDKANTIVFTFLWLMGYYIVMSQRQSLHVSSFVSACRSVMHHFSASRYMALHSANRFMSIQFIVSACRSCSISLAVAPVASRTWFPYSSSRSIHMHHVIMHQRCRYMSVVST